MANRAFDIEMGAQAYGGACVGRLADGRAVFVPFTLPGERVRARLVEERKGFARAELIEVQRPSKERVKPRCPHFTHCGGCHYQHMEYAAQLRAKELVLRDQLVRIAGLNDPPVREAVPSPVPWNYRNTLQFHLSPNGKLGFQPMGSQDFDSAEQAGGRQVVEIRECHLPEAGIHDLWPRLNFEPGPLARISLRLGTDGEALLVLEGQEAPELSVEELPLSVVFQSEDESIVLAGGDATLHEVLGRVFRVSAGSFFQVNTLMAEKMVEKVIQLLNPQPEDMVLDLYSGAGLFSAFLAPLAREVVGIELVPSACADYAVNLDEFENVSLYEGAVERVLPELKLLPGRPPLAVIDPPRAGLDRAAMDALIACSPRRIAYVSCDPATLARDVKKFLVSGYRLEESTPFDLFPQTYHIESISLLVKA